MVSNKRKRLEKQILFFLSAGVFTFSTLYPVSVLNAAPSSLPAPVFGTGEGPDSDRKSVV